MTQSDENQLNPRDEKVWRFHQEGKDAYWISQQFHVSPAAIAAWLLEIQRKKQEGKEEA